MADRGGASQSSEHDPYGEQSEQTPLSGVGGAAISARGLSRRFGPHHALQALDLDVAPGESFGLLGANGAGKTTFIRLLTGYLIPSAGRIEVDGLSPSERPQRVQAQLGYVPEVPRLYPELRVEGFLRFMAGVRGLRGAERSAAVLEVLERFQLGPVRGRLIGNLSKGYRQRVSLAQAFLRSPRLLIVDEPTSGLDPLQRQEVREVLAGLRGERTLLLCTHDLAEARSLTDRVAVLHAGQLVAVGESARILDCEDPLSLFRGQAVEAGR